MKIISNLLLFSLLVLLAACTQEENIGPDISDEITVAEVKTHFQSLPGPVHARAGEKPELFWERHAFRQIPAGQAILFPLDKVQNQFISGDGGETYFPVASLAYGIAYKLDGEIRLDYVEPVPTESYQPFTGFVKMGPWGEAPTHFLFYEEGEYIGFELPYDAQASGRGRIDGTAIIKECWTTTYLSCTMMGEVPDPEGDPCVSNGSVEYCTYQAEPGLFEAEPLYLPDGNANGPGGETPNQGSNSDDLCPSPLDPLVMVPCNEASCAALGMVPGENGGCVDNWEINQTFGKLCDDIIFLYSAQSFKAEIKNLGGTWINEVNNQIIDIELGINCVDIPEYYIGTAYDAATGFALIFNNARTTIERELEWGLLEPNTTAVRKRLIGVITNNLKSTYPGSTFGLSACQGSIPATTANYGC